MKMYVKRTLKKSAIGPMYYTDFASHVVNRTAFHFLSLDVCPCSGLFWFEKYLLKSETSLFILRVYLVH